ncbi:MAG: hypothetical protein IPP51_14015 [Bacteroidetes bacterium]|nr:hypothetical protein [Bacteroidota bacterium]
MKTPFEVTETSPAFYAILYVTRNFPLFTRPGYFRIVNEVMKDFCLYEAMNIRGYVIMPDFIQFLYQAEEKQAEIVLKHFALRLSLQLLDYIENSDDRKGRWLQSFFKESNSVVQAKKSVWGDIHFERIESMRIAQSIIHDMNHLPVREGIVTSAEAYLHSGASSRNWSGEAEFAFLFHF